MKPGRELDTLIAKKIMGRPACKNCIYQSAVPHCVEECGFHPHYSTDIAAAWQVVEKLFTLNGEPTVLQIYGPLEDGYKVTPVWEHHDGAIPEKSIVRKTAPHAICLAALAAVGVDI